MEEIEKNKGGLAVLAPTNCVAIDGFNDYLLELKQRIEASNPA